MKEQQRELPSNQSIGHLGRRGMLAGLLNLLAVLVSCVSSPGPSYGRKTQAGLPKGSSTHDKLSEELLSDLTRLSSRTYSEEGVAMFLVCENLTSSPSAQSTKSAKAENARLLAEFHRRAAVMPQIRPEAKDEDVPKIVEVLAEREFGALSTKQPQ